MYVILSCRRCSSAFRVHETHAPLRLHCSAACYGATLRETRTTCSVTEQWLRQKCEVERLGAPEIGDIVGRDAKTVWQWLRNFGIPTRKRGEDQRKGFKKGDPPAFAGHRHTPEVRERIRQLRIADGRVPYLVNGKHHLKGKRGAEVPAWKGGRTPERQAFYSSEAWRVACSATWARADAKCERCGLDHRTVDRTKTRFHVHHIVSFQVRELRAEVSNLALLCDRCHRFIHSRGNVAKEFIRCL